VLNRLTNMLDGVGTTRYTYDGVSQILSEDGPWSDDTVTYGYTAMQRTSLSLQQPTGSWTNGFAYDNARRLSSVTSPAGTFNYYYDAVRSLLPAEITLPNTSIITNAYDVNARLLSTVLKNSAGATLDAAMYGYNPGNQRTTFTNAAGTDVGYTYDSIGQLKVAASSVSSENRGYTYDAAWNVSNVTNNGVNNTFSVNNLNELKTVNSSNFVYDANGNMTNWSFNSGVSFNFTNYYDDENRLIGVASMVEFGTPMLTTFVYDGFGRLREQMQWTNSGLTLPQSITNTWTLVGGIAYVYDGNRVIQERDLNNNPLVAYTRGKDVSGTLEGASGIGGLLARSDSYSSGNFSDHNFYHADGNGNITYLVNSSQTLAASYRYDPFGNLTSSSGSLATNNTYRFSSKEFIPSVGMYYYLYRFNNPGLQRWMNRDPYGLRGGINAYLFVRNNPMGNLDPLGLCFSDESLYYRNNSGTSSSSNNSSNNSDQWNQGVLPLLTDLWIQSGGSLDFTVSGGLVLGGEGRLSYVPLTGEWDFGLGIGLGFGFETSLTANLNSGSDRGWNVQGEVAGGGILGASVLGEISQAGINNSGGVGFGVGEGATLSAGYTWSNQGGPPWTGYYYGNGVINQNAPTQFP
jgi:RHS repeat-associated protein